MLCENCQREIDEDDPVYTALKIGAGVTAEYISITPITAALLLPLVRNPGTLQPWDRIHFQMFNVARPSKNPGTSKNPRRVAAVILCRLRRDLKGLNQRVGIEVIHGRGLILRSDVPVELARNR